MNLADEYDLNQGGSGELWLDVVRRLIGGSGQSLIDVCCAEATLSRHLDFSERVFIDVKDWDLRPRELNFVQCDALGNSPVFDREYEVAICSDGIEHFWPEDALRLAERLAKIGMLAIIFTPLGELGVTDRTADNSADPDSHKSGWLPDSLPGWQALVFPNWHPSYGCGALFYWKDRRTKTTP